MNRNLRAYIVFKKPYLTRKRETEFMSEQQDLKLTDLDYLIGSHHLQMMKAALPFMNVSEQRLISIFVKMNELTKTMELFKEGEVATMGICSMEKQATTPVDMLNAIKPYGTTYEQDFIDLISNFMQGSRIYNNYQATMGPDAPQGEGGFKNPLDQIRNFLSPEQQSRIDTAQMMMQMIQGMT